jgi:hypothetical protein
LDILNAKRNKKIIPRARRIARRLRAVAQVVGCCWAGRQGLAPFLFKNTKKKKRKPASSFQKKRPLLHHAPCECDDRVARGAGEAGEERGVAGGGSGVVAAMETGTHITVVGGKLLQRPGTGGRTSERYLLRFQYSTSRRSIGTYI